MNTDQPILIIEDDDFLRSLAVTKLEKEGFTVDVAVDGVQGVNKIKEIAPALVLLDIMLPHLDGFGVLQQLQDENLLSQQKVIIFSNLGSEEDIRSARAFSIEDYLVKSSFTLDELVEKIRATLVK